MPSGESVKWYRPPKELRRAAIGQKPSMAALRPARRAGTCAGESARITSRSSALPTDLSGP